MEACMDALADVDEYIAALPADQRAALEELRRTIRTAAPEATEAISYQIPSFRDGDRALVSYAAFKNHCSLFPMSTTVMAAHAAELEPFLAGKGTIRFTPDVPLPAAIVEKLVKARLEENVARRGR